MRPTASFYQFTYGPRCPVPRPILDRLGLKAVRIGGTVRNIPPASVYRITQRQPLGISRRAPNLDGPTA
jgi:phospholipid N-methyltransferase